VGRGAEEIHQIEHRAKEMDSNVEIVAPVVADNTTRLPASRHCLRAWPEPGRPRHSDWTGGAVAKKREENVAKEMARGLMNNNSPMDYHGALGVLRTIHVGVFQNGRRAAPRTAMQVG